MVEDAPQVDGWQIVVDALTRPLQFAAKNVSRLAGFESLVDVTVKKARGRVSDAALDAIASAARGFDRASDDEKRARVDALLALLTRGPASFATGAPPASDALSVPLAKLKGFGPKRVQELAKRGFVTVGDVLFTLPRTYEDRRATRRISELQEGAVAVVSGTVAASGIIGGMRGRGGRRRFEAVLDDGSGRLSLVFFHFRPLEMQKRFVRGAVVTASGEVASYGAKLQMVHPKTSQGARVDELGGVHPVYPEVLGLHPLELGRACAAGVDVVAERGVVDPLPPAVRSAAGVVGLGEALLSLHTPRDDVDEGTFRAMLERRTPAHKRLAFEELFVLGIALALRRRSGHADPAPALAPVEGEREALLRLLPFKLTRAQERAIEEVGRDLAAPVPMARLLQGDVGSGKTAVAAAACLRAVRAGHQAAFMAPTELLAEQHARTLRALLAPAGVRVEVLTGSLKKKQRALAEARLANRDIDVVVGTQALLSEGVTFARLGLCIADEQHRFGVVQRASMRAKGPVVEARQLTPHLLVMTATPIPRSLALTVYGDLAVSVLDEMPPGRAPVTTKASADIGAAREAVRAVLERGERAFVVYPVIDESMALDVAAATAAFDEWKALFGESVALLHGRMDAKTREETMARFAKGDVRVLVSTTVIEVGVDVPDATLMVIVNAERFGLAQLHQLRGRVGRSSKRSECILVVGAGAGEEAQRRVDVVVSTQDGFRIAEEDLALRGPGDVLGTRQSGLPSLAFSDLVRHAPLIELSRKLADDVVAGDPALAAHAGLRKLVLERYAARLALTGSG